MDKDYSLQGWTMTTIFMDMDYIFMDLDYCLQEWTMTIVFTDMDLKDKDNSLHKQGL